MNKKTLSIIFSFFVTIIWGLSFYAVGNVNSSFGPSTIVLIRFSFALLPLIIYNLITHSKFFCRKEDLKLVIISSILGGGVYYFLSAIATRIITNSQAVSVSSFQIILVLIVYSFVDDKVINPKTTIAIALCSIGAILSAKINDFLVAGIGSIIYLVATLMWALYLFAIRKLMKTNKISTILTHNFIISIIMMLPLTIGEENNFSNLATYLPSFIYLGIFCITLCFTLNAYSVKHIGIMNTSIFIGIIPIWIFIIDTFILNLGFDTYHLLGVVLIIIGEVVMIKELFRKNRDNEFR